MDYGDCTSTRTEEEERDEVKKAEAVAGIGKEAVAEKGG